MLLIKNNAQSVLASALTSTATACTVKAGDGNKFSATGPSDVFELTFINSAGVTEIVDATRSLGSDTINITRRPGARAWNVDDTIVGQFITERIMAPLTVMAGAATESAIRLSIKAATTENVTQTFLGAITFSNTIAFTGAVNMTATTQNINVATSQTTGSLLVGGTAQTGTITVGRSTKTSTLNFGTGVTESGLTKTINLGTGGVAGSATNINIGQINGGKVKIFSPVFELDRGRFAQGSALSPSISFVGDVDTGIYSNAANNLAFVTNG